MISTKYAFITLIGLLCPSLGIAHANAPNGPDKAHTTVSPSLVAPSEDKQEPEEASSDSTAEDLPPQESATIHSIIQCQPKDSKVVFDFQQQTILMEGEGVIEYDVTKIEAENIVFNWAQRIITISGKKDEHGKTPVKATLTQDQAQYVAATIRYHLDSQRSVATELSTKQGDGLLRAEKIKKEGSDIFYGNQSIYTTCDLKEPHFHIATEQFKLVQDDKIISGGFRLYFDGVPTPLGLPFGLFFLPQASGIIAPTYTGFDTYKGFGLTDGGYYFHFNDYTDLTLKGDIYSKLTTSLKADFRYKKRYQYGGSFFYQGNWDRHSPSPRKSWRFRWEHNTENNKTSSLNADVSLESESFKDFYSGHNSRMNSRQNNTSSIHYTNELVGLPYRLDAKLRYNSYVTNQAKTREEDLTAPEFYIATNKIYPFKQGSDVIDRWYPDIYFTHKFEASNKFKASGTLSREGVGKLLTFLNPSDWPELFTNSQYGAKHTLPVQTDFKLFNYFSFTPNFTWVDRWYGEKFDYAHSEQKKSNKSFYRVGSWNFGAALSTFLYGTYVFPEAFPVQAIRHEVQPYVRFEYTPDLSDPKYGYFQALPNSKNSYERKRYRYNEIYGRPASEAHARLSMSLNNQLTMKIDRGSDGQVDIQKIPILKQFDWHVDYDFLKERHQFDDISLNARTNLLDELVKLELKTTFDPYWYEKVNDEYKKREDFAWQHGQGFAYVGNMKDASFNVGLRLGPLSNSSAFNLYGRTKDYSEKSSEHKKEQQSHTEVSKNYANFNVPWGVSLDYHVKHWGIGEQKWGYNTTRSKSIDQKLDIDGVLNLGERWDIVIRSTYDITKGELRYDNTSIDITRDLHCWEMRFSCKPWGEQEHYEFKIGVKAPSLQFIRYGRERYY